MSGSTLGPRNEAGEPEDARPTAGAVVDAVDAVEGLRTRGSESPAVTVRLYQFEPDRGDLVMGFFGLAIMAFIVGGAVFLSGWPWYAKVPFGLVFGTLTAFVAPGLVGDDCRLEVGADRLIVRNSEGDLAQEWDRSVVGEVELRDRRLTIKHGSRHSLKPGRPLKYRLSQSQASRAAEALTRYGWLG